MALYELEGDGLLPMGDSLRCRAFARQHVASPRHVSDPLGAPPFGDPRSDGSRGSGGKDLGVELMGVGGSHRACVTCFPHWQVFSRQARLPTLAFSLRPQMEVARHDASPDPSGLLVAWGHHCPFLAPDGVSREVDAVGKLTWGTACDYHVLVVAAQSVENPLYKASNYVAGEHHLVDHFPGLYWQAWVCSWSLSLGLDPGHPEPVEVVAEEDQTVVVGHIVTTTEGKALFGWAPDQVD